MELKHIPFIFTCLFGLLTGLGVWFIRFDVFVGLNYLLWGLSPLLFLMCCCLSCLQYIEYKTQILPT